MFKKEKIPGSKKQKKISKNKLTVARPQKFGTLEFTEP